METIIEWLQEAILATVPVLDVSNIPGKASVKLKLSAEQLLLN